MNRSRMNRTLLSLLLVLFAPPVARAEFPTRPYPAIVYTYEAQNVVMLGNEYKDSVVYGMDPHDRSLLSCRRNARPASCVALAWP